MTGSTPASCHTRRSLCPPVVIVEIAKKSRDVSHRPRARGVVRVSSSAGGSAMNCAAACPRSLRRRRQEFVATGLQDFPMPDPDTARPGPNRFRTAPSRSPADASISVFLDQAARAASTGRSRRPASMKPGPVTRSAAAITTARLGSQSPKISRKASTFAGCSIPEINSPKPNSNPQINAATTTMAQPANT